MTDLRHWISALGRAGQAGLVIVALFTLVAFVMAVVPGPGDATLASGAGQWEPASTRHWFGTNRLGQDVFARAMGGAATAIKVGTLVTALSLLLGAAAGAAVGWRQGGWVDTLVVWLMGVLDAIPFYLFAAALAFALGAGTLAMYAAMVLTFWTATARLVRAEVLRLRQMDYVASARAIGLPGWRIAGRHLLPNCRHLLLVQAVLTFVAAIKTEVILSFLGIGVRDGVSWGLMLSEATQDVLAGHFGNFLAASLLMFILLLGFNLLADALQDRDSQARPDGVRSP
ncbi:ABC transporter permease [Marinihelvus fidelis]|uniref:ABC transporter permease n=1 Tax=Marinihelvus fidelis TaxID=2613842 RepID=A0A5N0TAS9_9GAMM|nr:ABC transporter permease [Marinihelvus fidelis]KAA9130926.1 ABC transporter permease [Marinihelvus fidelis]